MQGTLSGVKEGYMEKRMEQMWNFRIGHFCGDKVWLNWKHFSLWPGWKFCRLSSYGLAGHVDCCNPLQSGLNKTCRPQKEIKPLSPTGSSAPLHTAAHAGDLVGHRVTPTVSSPCAAGCWVVHRLWAPHLTAVAWIHPLASHLLPPSVRANRRHCCPRFPCQRSCAAPTASSHFYQWKLASRVVGHRGAGCKARRCAGRAAGGCWLGRAELPGPELLDWAAEGWS